MKKLISTLLFIQIIVFSYGQTEHCLNDAEITVNRFENPSLNSTGPFLPGETVEFCYKLDFASGSPADSLTNNCQWLQGIIPTIGLGWDRDLNYIDTQGPGEGWQWLESHEVDINVDHEHFGLSSNCEGELILKHDDTGIEQGALLPAGFWFSSNGAGNCLNDGHPNNSWGSPQGCGSERTYEFCFQLTAREENDQSNDCYSDFSITFYSLADGLTGCWGSPFCVGDPELTLELDQETSLVSKVDKVSYKIYPNPSSEFINVQTEEILNFELLDSFGKNVLNGQIDNSNSKINVAHLDSGIYFLRVKNKYNSYKLSSKIILE